MSPKNDKRILSPRKRQKSILNFLKPSNKKSPKNKAKRKLDYDDNDQLNAGKSFILQFIPIFSTFLFKEYRTMMVSLWFTVCIYFFYRISRMSRIY